MSWNEEPPEAEEPAKDRSAVKKVKTGGSRRNSGATQASKELVALFKPHFSLPACYEIITCGCTSSAARWGCTHGMTVGHNKHSLILVRSSQYNMDNTKHGHSKLPQIPYFVLPDFIWAAIKPIKLPPTATRTTYWLKCLNVLMFLSEIYYFILCTELF